MKHIILLSIFIISSYFSYCQIEQLDEIIEKKHIVKGVILSDSTLLFLKDNKELIEYNFRSREEKEISIGNTKPVNFAISHDKRIIAIISKNKVLSVHDLLNGSLITSFEEEYKSFPKIEFISETNELVFFDTEAGKIRVYSLIEDKLIHIIDLEKKFIFDYSIGSKFIGLSLLGENKNFVQLYDKKSFLLQHELTTSNFGFFAPIETKNTDKMIIGTSNSELLVWNIKENKITRKIPANKEMIRKIVFLNNMDNFISCCSRGKIYHWKFDSYELLEIINAHTEQIYAADKLSESNIFLTLGFDRKIKIWTLKK